MGRIDCSNVLNFVKEHDGMCSMIDCSKCRLSSCTDDINRISQYDIDIIQDWSDANPRMTRKDKFIKICEENGFNKILEYYLSDFGDCERKCPACVCTSCDKCEEYWNEDVKE